MILKTNHIESVRRVGGDNFYLKYTRRINKTLQKYLDEFDSDNYWIIKMSDKQRIVTYDDLLEFKHSGYIFFRKDLYDIENIMNWFNFEGFMMKFLSKPTPPFSPKNIIIKK